MESRLAGLTSATSHGGVANAELSVCSFAMSELEDHCSRITKMQGTDVSIQSDSETKTLPKRTSLRGTGWPRGSGAAAACGASPSASRRPRPRCSRYEKKYCSFKNASVDFCLSDNTAVSRGEQKENATSFSMLLLHCASRVLSRSREAGRADEQRRVRPPADVDREHVRLRVEEGPEAGLRAPHPGHEGPPANSGSPHPPKLTQLPQNEVAQW